MNNTPGGISGGGSTAHIPPATTSHVSMGHFNMQKGKEVNVDFQQYAVEMTNNLNTPILYALQEPHCYYSNGVNCISGMASENLIYSRTETDKAVGSWPRAALFFSPCINIHPLHEFIDQDLATGVWNTGDQTTPTIVVASVYMDRVSKTPIRESSFMKLIKYCHRKNLPLLVQGDLNGWSSLWGEMDRLNDRGRIYEEIILQYDLTVLNTGQMPEMYTWRNKKLTKKSIIDVTLCSPSIAHMVEDWGVSDLSSSDHRNVHYKMELQCQATFRTRNFRKGNWAKFSRLMGDKDWDTRRIWTVAALRDGAQHFVDTVNKCLDESHPIIHKSYKLKSPEWYDLELTNLRKRCKRAQDTYRRCGLGTRERRHAELREAYQIYHKALKAKKRISWQQFVEKHTNFEAVAKFNKMLNRTSLNSLGIIKDANGEAFDSPEQSLNHLTEIHFKDCKDSKPTNIPPSPPDTLSVDLDSQDVEFITKERVLQAIESFGDYKCGSGDGIKPIVLKNMGNSALTHLTTLIKVSHLLGYVPDSWRDSKVIFIPKPGKSDYTNPKSYRPISLLSFLFKVHERVVLYHLQETILVDSPLSIDQHGFRKGRSCESALSNFVEQIETANEKQQYALAVFLDIEGAFDGVTIPDILQALGNKKVDRQTIRWYEHFLYNRSITVDYKGNTIHKYLTRGTPQGGVLSPIAWNLVFDTFLRLFTGKQVTVTGYCDDAAICCVGPNPKLLVKRVQSKINEALSWGGKHKLLFSPQKTVAVMFTRKIKKPLVPIPNIKVGDFTVPYSTTAKYLGVIMDHKLSWTTHIENKIKACKRLLHKVRATAGSLWGLSPKLALWLYKSIVRPKLTYGCLVWARVTEFKRIKRKLNSLQRLALKMLGHFRKSTPGPGLEILTLTTPLDLHIRQEALMAYYRTEGISKITQGQLLGLEKLPSSKPHRAYIAGFETQIDFVKPGSDTIAQQFNWDHKYTLDQESFKEGKPDDEADINIYTDGSQNARHDTGAGFVIYNKTTEPPLTEKSFYLGRFATVFQSEVYAIYKAADNMLGENCSGKTITIFSDSSAALQAINKNTIVSQLVLDATITLNSLAEQNTVTLKKVAAHSSHLGNDRADFLAKEGAKDTENPVPDQPLVSNQVIRNELRAKVQEFWNQEWMTRVDCRQTRHFFPTIDVKLSKQIISCGRRTMSALVQFLTGHNFMRRHESIIYQGYNDPEGLAYCNFCEQDLDQSSYHIFAECETFADHRQRWFGARELSLPFDVLLTVGNILGFLRDIQIQCLLYDEGDDDPEEETH